MTISACVALATHFLPRLKARRLPVRVSAGEIPAQRGNLTHPLSV